MAYTVPPSSPCLSSSWLGVAEVWPLTGTTYHDEIVPCTENLAVLFTGHFQEVTMPVVQEDLTGVGVDA